MLQTTSPKIQVSLHSSCSAYHHLIPPLSALSLQFFPTVFRARKFKFLRNTPKVPQTWLLHTFYFHISQQGTPSKSRHLLGSLDLPWNFETSGNTKAINFCEFTLYSAYSKSFQGYWAHLTSQKPLEKTSSSFYR